jgi:16S rRNA (adenine1518-N6/adenine1519-N6)-dimethyltransferase
MAQSVDLLIKICRKRYNQSGEDSVDNKSSENSVNYNSPSSIKAFLDAYGLSAQKRFGQHFLINEGARDKLIEALDVQAGDAVWEIGPGLGAMTRLLLDRGARVTVFEIDQGFVGALNTIFAKEIAEKRLTVVAGDALKTWPECSAQAGEAPLSLLGNLPYNIAGALLGDFIEKGRLFSRAAVTVQKEVAARITARSGDKDYSSLAVLFSLVYETKKICLMKGSFFYPPPNVDSTALCFYPKDGNKNGTKADVPPVFFPLVRALFSRRRKTIYNNLCCFAAEYEPLCRDRGRGIFDAFGGVPRRGGSERPREGPTARSTGWSEGETSPIQSYISSFCEAALARCGIAKNERAENLTVDDFRKIAECLIERKGQC